MDCCTELILLVQEVDDNKVSGIFILNIIENVSIADIESFRHIDYRRFCDQWIFLIPS